MRWRSSFRKPGVLDGNDCLRGKVRHQFDLLVGERSHLLTIYSDCTNECAFLEHGYNEKRSSAAAINKCD